MGLLFKKPNSYFIEREKKRILIFKNKGYNNSIIAIKIKILYTIIFSFLFKYAKTNNFILAKKPGSKGVKKLIAKAKRVLVRKAINEPKIILKVLTTLFKSDKKLNYYIVARIFKRHGKAKRRPRKKLYLNTKYKLKKKRYCRTKFKLKRSHKKIVWSNKIIFEIEKNTTYFFITKRPGKNKKYAKKNFKPSFKSDRKTVKVWSYFCENELNAFYILFKNINMIKERYHYVL